MKDISNIWEKIKNDRIEYKKPEVGVSDGIYMTSDYVFKKGSENDIWKNMYVNIESDDNGVKTPSVIWYSKNKDVVAYKRIKGDMMSEINEEKSNELAYNVGKHLREMHSGSYYGYSVSPEWNNIRGEYESYDIFVNNYLESSLEIPDKSDFKDFVYQCSNIIKSVDVPEKRESSILHADLHSQNIIVTEEDVYIIDFENAILGPSEMDVVHSYLMMDQGKGSQFVDNFLSGYGIKIDNMNEIGICMGVLKEVNAARWWEKKSKNMNSRRKTLEKFTDKYL